MISVVIPTLDSQRTLPETLASLVPGVVAGLIREAVVVDGGSSDATATIAEAAGCRVETAERGRGAQLRRGCELAKSDWILALHADTRLEPGWVETVRRHLERHPGSAGYFRLRFDDASLRARTWEVAVAVRCAVLALPYGDQGLLVPRSLYQAVGGYPQWPLMEDVELVSRIGRSRLVRLRATALTDAERFRRSGWIRRSLKNLELLVRWRLGESPASLARSYD